MYITLIIFPKYDKMKKKKKGNFVIQVKFISFLQ